MITEYDLAHTSCAEFSDDMRYRYTLRRCFAGSVDSPPVRPIVFCMLNPSTASAFVNDPTIRRCIGFAQDWGYTDLIVVNLFAIRETNSKILHTFVDPVGPQNNEALANLPRSPVVCAWGSHPMARERAYSAVYHFGSARRLCLKQTQDGSPSHPLYLPKVSTLKSWPGYAREGVT